jgi:hypothetical protein
MNRRNIKIVDLYLDLKNPRQETSSQEEAIDWLCEHEKIDELASDIVENGLSPLELPAVLKNEENYWNTLEGNRRICALKLLLEPELSPNLKTKNRFLKLKVKWENPIQEIECVCFSTREESDIWLDRLHIGQQDGLGRVKWNPAQIQRRSDSPENKRALMVLDYCIKNNWVSASSIDNKLTTATRYLNNESFRNSLGMGESISALTHRRPLNIFVTDLITNPVDGSVSSRADKVKIENYGNSLLAVAENLTTHEEKNIFPISTIKVPTPAKPVKKSKPQKPTSPPNISINHSQDVTRCLEAHGNTKLKSLYYSLCTLDLNVSHNIPLATVGAWSFLESLTKDCGRGDKATFKDFVFQKIQNQFTSESRGIKKALAELESLGNLTKHDSTYSAFNGEMIASIMETLNPVIAFLLTQLNSINQTN